LTQQSEDFNPLTSSKTTLATFQNPFGFSLQVVQASENITIGFNGADAAAVRLFSLPSSIVADRLVP
jgi:hypothetical protein